MRTLVLEIPADHFSKRPTSTKEPAQAGKSSKRTNGDQRDAEKIVFDRKTPTRSADEPHERDDTSDDGQG
ncbi:hypothetical protein Pen01_36180 [Phytomonospora endophytica]|nr:hypothetical protein Pen01_36180 [Phytomonospora endophytica]